MCLFFVFRQRVNGFANALAPHCSSFRRKHFIVFGNQTKLLYFGCFRFNSFILSLKRLLFTKMKILVIVDTRKTQNLANKKSLRVKNTNIVHIH